MKKALSLASTLILAVLIVSILRASPGGPNPSLINESDAPSPGNETTDISRIPEESISSTVDEPSTDTSSVTDTTELPSLEAELVLSEVVFGEDGYVVIRNVGGASGNTEGYALCQRPGYFFLPSVELAPFEVVWIAVETGQALTSTAVAAIVDAHGELGALDPEGGEVALYRSSDFADPESLVSYVEWGTAGHGRSSVAIEAELWTEGAFIEVPDDAFGVVSTEATPSSPQHWVAWIGG